MGSYNGNKRVCIFNHLSDRIQERPRLKQITTFIQAYGVASPALIYNDNPVAEINMLEGNFPLLAMNIEHPMTSESDFPALTLPKGYPIIME